MRRAGLLILCLCMLTVVGCRRMRLRPNARLRVQNFSGATLKNLEVDYAAGGYSYTSFVDRQWDERDAHTVRPCMLSLRFEDAKSRPQHYRYSNDKACPKSITLSILPNSSVRAFFDGKPQP